MNMELVTAIEEGMLNISQAVVVLVQACEFFASTDKESRSLLPYYADTICTLQDATLQLLWDAKEKLERGLTAEENRVKDREVA